MLQNSRVTAFTVSELLRDNQLGGKITPTPPRLGLKPVDEWYRDKMNTMKTERKGKSSYTEKINTHVPSG